MRPRGDACAATGLKRHGPGIRALHALTLLVVTVGLGACDGGCRRGGPSAGTKAVLEAVPADARLVAWAPTATALLELEQRVTSVALARRGLQLTGLGSREALDSTLAGALGLSELTPEGLEEIGLDPDGAIALGWMSDDVLLFVLPARDRRKLSAAVEYWAETRLGAAHRRERGEGDSARVELAVHEGGPPLVAHGWRGDLLLIELSRAQFAVPGSRPGSDPGAPSATPRTTARPGQGPTLGAQGPLARALTLSRARSVGADARLTRAREKLQEMPRLSLWAPEGLRASGYALPLALLVAASTEGEGLTLEGLVDWPNTAASLDGFVARPVEGSSSLSGPGGAFAAARFTGRARELAPLLQLFVPASLRRALAEAGQPMEAWLELLGPGGELSLSLADDARPARGVGALDPRQANPFETVQLLGSVPLAEPAGARARLEGLPALGRRVGLTMTARELGGRAGWTTRWHRGEGLHLALDDQHLYFGSPLAHLERALGEAPAEEAAAEEAPAEEVPAEEAPAEEAASNETEGRPSGPVRAVRASPFALAVALDTRTLGSDLRALPSRSWGPAGFAMQAAVGPWIKSVESLGMLELGVGAEEGWIHWRLRASFAGSPDPIGPDGT